MRSSALALAMATISMAAIASCARAKPPAEVDWLLAATTQDMVVFLDNKAGRIERNRADATVFTVHVLSAPTQISGAQVSWFLRRSKYDCLKPQVSQQSALGYDEREEIVFTDTAEKPMI